MVVKRKRAPRAAKAKHAAPPAPRPRGLLFKVVELSTVDESSLQDAVNEWVQRGWTFDGVQFAMRESSRRPAMAFVFFTREAAAKELEAPGAARSPEEAERHLMRLAGVPRPTAPPVSAYERLIELAEGGDDE